jgi:hypothetical protein
VTGITRQSPEEQEPSSLKLANGAWGDVPECLKQFEAGDGFTTSFKFIIGADTKPI